MIIYGEISEPLIKRPNFRGSGRLRASATVARPEGTLVGEGGLAVSTVTTPIARARITSDGGLAVDAQTDAIQIVLSGEGTLSGDYSSAAFAGAGGLSATATAIFVAKASSPGAGGFTEQHNFLRIGKAKFAGAGLLNTFATSNLFKVPFAGAGQLSALATGPWRVNASLMGSTNLSALAITPPLFANTRPSFGATAATTASPALPTSVTTNNLLIAFIQLGSCGGQTITETTDWVVGATQFDTASSGVWAWRVVDGTEAAPVFAWDGSPQTWHGQVIQISGADYNNPFGTISGACSSGTNIAVPAFAAGSDQSRVFQIDLVSNAQTIPLQDNFTNALVIEAPTGSHRVSYETLPTQGYPADSASVVIDNANWLGFLIELLPPVLPWVVRALDGRGALIARTNEITLNSAVLSGDSTLDVDTVPPAAAEFDGAGSVLVDSTASHIAAATLNGQSSFAALPGPDPFWSEVVMLMGFDGTNGSTSFTDESSIGRTLTTVGNAQVTTTSPPYGSGWGLFDGSGDRITAPNSTDFQFGSGDFTVELTVNLSTKTTSQAFCGMWDNGGVTSNDCWFLFSSSGSLLFRIVDTGLTVRDVSYAWTPTLGTTYHLAVDRSGSTLRMYIDGVMVATATSYTYTMHTSTGKFVVGAIGDANSFSSFDFNGKMDELRITKGVARYASNAGYTVAAAAFPRGG